jgi:hypothetical protein
MDLHPVQAQHHNHNLTNGIGCREALLFHLTLQCNASMRWSLKPPTARQSPPQASGSTHMPAPQPSPPHPATSIPVKIMIQGALPHDHGRWRGASGRNDRRGDRGWGGLRSNYRV